ncbi:small, acid-soluble spore protein, H family [Piscibacillus salipiscarius]|uniref:small, acid-soluble spore protein, H family n=1 Tax=Piscibacillus salipiscarius TaxID=299480 RepID=UPI0024367CB5|nr:small, acid-soluble spore protein, H family [Piscibacillus salipiscarius]
MNLMRAKEIKEDPNMKDVVYNEEYVYIDDVDDERQKAIIHYLNVMVLNLKLM